MNSRLKNFSASFFKWLMRISGIFALLFLILSFTDLPYYAYHYLGTCNSRLYYPPNVIVLLGGAGMPSPDGLTRTYYTAKLAEEYPQAKIIIALPFDEEDSSKQLRLMEHELVIRGVDSSGISFEGKGFNTHTQAEHIAEMIGENKNISLAIVTSPEHMYRSVKTFLKFGYTHVAGVATFENPVDEEEVKDTDTRTDTRVKSVALRYNMWSYMQYELLVLKEYFAISYYWMKGWI